MKSDLAQCEALLPHLPADVEPTQVECFENNVYLGTRSGHLLLYALDHLNPSQSPPCIKKKSISKGPIHELFLFVDWGLLLVYTEQTLYFLDYINFDAVGLTPIRSVLYACVHHHCLYVFRKKSVQIYTLAGRQRIVLDREWPSDVPLLAQVSGEFVGYATAETYALLNGQTGRIQVLFPYDRLQLQPQILAVDHTDFLFVTGDAQHAMGVFVSTEGSAVRGTIQWDQAPWSLAFTFPYILALCPTSLVIHHAVNLHCIQHLSWGQSLLRQPSTLFPVVGLRLLHFYARSPATPTSSNDPPLSPDVSMAMTQSRILCSQYTAIEKGIYALVFNWSQHLQQHILAGHVQEAIQMVESSEQPMEVTVEEVGTSSLQTLRLTSKTDVLKYACRICMEHGRFIDGIKYLQDYFIFDPKMLLSWYEQQLLLPWSQVQCNSETDAGERVDALVKYLLACRHHIREMDISEELVDNGICKVLAETKHPGLYPFLEKRNACTGELQSFLESKKLYYAASLLLKASNRVGDVLVMWKNILDGVTPDDSFPGFDVFIVYFMEHLQTKEMFQETLVWLARHDGKRIRHVFELWFEKPQIVFELNAEEIIRLLEPCTKTSAISFLEIYVRHDTSTKYHNQLARLYIHEMLDADNKLFSKTKTITAAFTKMVLRSSTEPPSFFQFLKTYTNNQDPLFSNRIRLIRFLEESTSYDVSFILNLLEGTLFYSEQAILHGRLKHHDVVLELLIHRLHDFTGSENYCFRAHSQHVTEDASAPNLYTRLLETYLRLPEHEEMVPRVLEFLHKHAADLDLQATLDLLPRHWSLKHLSSFLCRTLVESVNLHHNTRLHKSVQKAHFTSIQSKWAENMQRPPLLMTESSSQCRQCGKQIRADHVFGTLQRPFKPDSPPLVMHLSCLQRFQESEAESKRIRNLRGVAVREQK